MKKKRNVLVLLSLILVCILTLSACSLVSVNKERQANRVMATVTVDLAKEYDGIKEVMGNDWDYVVSLDVTRRDLISTVNYTLNYMAQLYAQLGSAYNYDVESITEAGLKNLVSQRYRVIRAMGDLLVNSKKTGRYDALYCNTSEYQAIYGKKFVPEGVLTIAERYNAVGNVNSQLLSQLESYTEETKNDERDNEISNANIKISQYYNEGYFVRRVEVGYKDAEGNFKDGLYKTTVVLNELPSSSSSSSSSSESKVSILDYNKVYVKVVLFAENKDDVNVYIPVDESNFKTDTDSANTATLKYHTNMTATVSYAGRVKAEITDDNKNGYEIENFTSKPVNFEVITPRSAYKSNDNSDDDVLKNLRYVSTATWNDTEKLTEEMKEHKADIFVTVPASYKTNEEKDAYRQLRNSLKKNNVGYEEEDPGKDSINYVNYKNYGGLKYYYDSQFYSEVLSAKQYELTEAVSATDAEITAEYIAQVNKDKANYESLSYAEQVAKFFSTITNDLSTAYYVPIEALTSLSYEVKPDDKKYAPLFTTNEEGEVLSYNEKYITEEDGKYTMKYAYKNDDDTYTINMIYVTHILFSLDNIVEISDAYKNTTADFEDADKWTFVRLFAEKGLKIRPQLAEYLAKYKEREDAEEEYEYTVEDLFGDEKAYAEIATEVNEGLAEAYANSGMGYVALLNKFIEYMETYNDDSGKLSGSGYLVSAGEMENKWYADFTDTALNIYFSLLNADKPVTNYDQTDGIDLEMLISDAYSDYGVHKMIISFAPLYHVSIDESGAFAIDTIVQLGNEDTRRETIKESLTKTEKDSIYKEWEQSFKEDEIKNYAQTNDKNYKALIKEYKK